MKKRTKFAFIIIREMMKYRLSPFLIKNNTYEGVWKKS